MGKKKQVTPDRRHFFLSILVGVLLFSIALFVLPAFTQAQISIHTQQYREGEKRLLDHPTEAFNDTLCLFFQILCFKSDIDNQTPQNTPVPQPTGSASPTIPPSTPESKEELEKAIKDQFGLIVTGFDEVHLLLIYSKLTEIEKTNFTQLTQGTTIKGLVCNGSSCPGSRQPSYKYIELAQYRNPEHFQVILIHELAHVIRNYAKRGESKLTQHIQVYNSSEGAVTEYGRTACGRVPTANNRYSEDYADMITYYLNPLANEQTVGPPCRANPGNPYAGGKHPKHFKLAQEILGTYP